MQIQIDVDIARVLLVQCINPNMIVRQDFTIDDGVIDHVYIDLDGVTADFEDGMNRVGMEADEFKMTPGSYVWLKPMPLAKEAIYILWQLFPKRVWFLTKPPKFSPYAYVEKALWVQHHFGDDGMHQLIVAQDKSLVGTEKSVLIDDRPHKGNVEKFRGRLIHFGSEVQPGIALGWKQVLNTINSLVEQRLPAYLGENQPLVTN